jgi:D-3-phosphoglycerate dehydrogenase
LEAVDLARKKILIAQKAHPEIIEMLKPHGELVTIRENNQEDLLDKIVDCEVVLLGTWIRFTSEIMDMAKNLKIISRTGVGVDSVDVEAATKRGIMVLHTPGANALTVAEHALTLIAALSKHIVFLDHQVRRGEFNARRLYLPDDLDKKTLGIIGFGAVGRILAAKCNLAFDMKILAYDPYVSRWPDWVGVVDEMEDIFRKSDYISLHLPLTKDNYNVVDSKMLSLMKPSAFLINTARGEIVDEKALYEALKGNKIAGAGLDVFKQEPPGLDCKLLTLPNVILTPHSGALTKECSIRVAKRAANGIIDYLQGETPAYLYNKEVIK